MKKPKKPKRVKYQIDNCCGGKKGGKRSEVTLLPEMKIAA
jgi:hypothetical protein